MKKQPSVKLKKYVKGVIEGKTKQQAAIDAGYSKTTATNPQIIEGAATFKTLLKTFEKEGIDCKWITRKVKEGGEATKLVTSPTGPDVEYPDFDQRGKYLDRALKLMGFEKDNHEGVKKRIVAEEFFND